MPRVTTDVILSEFDGHYMHLKPGNGKLWLTAREIGEALEYERPGEAICHLYGCHKDEFDSDCTRLPNTGMENRTGHPPVRIREFSLDGVMLLGMFSEQPKAKAFRKWARKVLTEVATTGGYGAKGKIRRYVPPSGERVHWTDTLCPSDALKVALKRADIWLALADRPRNRYLWNALYSTFGGRAGYAEYLEMSGQTPAKTAEEWRNVEERDPDTGLGDAWFGDGIIQ